MSTLIKQAVLKEGVTHLEELPLKQFIQTVETLKDRILTEKLDGSNLWFGYDETGFFTSREGKRTKSARFYSVSDYADVANFNSFRGAHEALAKYKSIIEKILEPTDIIEIEVLFGRQPNSVAYGVNDKNFIVVLRGIGDTPESRVNAISKALMNKKAEITALVIFSPDGKEIEKQDEKQTWEFTKVAPMKVTPADASAATERLQSLKDFLDETNEVLGMTNAEVSELSLTTIPKAERPQAKLERDRVNTYIMEEYKLPIKELLLNHLVRNVKPFLQGKDIDPSENTGIEGVVVRDPVTGTQIKIVDKDVFTAINTFNSSVRGTISGLVKTTDSSAPLVSRGGVFGEVKIKIAKLLGEDDLALSGGIRRLLKKLDITNPNTAFLKLSNSLKLSNPSMVKTKIADFLETGLKELEKGLSAFKEESNDYTLTLKTGKTIGYSPEVIKKTLTAFAEVRLDIEAIRTAVLKAKTGADLIAALYGKTISSILGGDIMTEGKSLIQSIHELSEDDGTTTAGDVSPNTGLNGLKGAIVTPPSDTAKGPLAYASGKPGADKATSLVPYKFKIVKGKMVVPRKRNFETKFKFARQPAPVKEHKFSLIKSINEATDSLDRMGNATNVDDKIQGQRDVKFTQSRNTVNMGTDVNPDDIYSYLNRAAELNDEPDSTIFGLEMSDGSVIKIYVNATQTDDFEIALGDMIGKFEDVEEVINTLAQNFDIIDVEWPEVSDEDDEDPAAQNHKPQASPEGADDEENDPAEDENPEIDMEIHDEQMNEDVTFTNQTLQIMQDILAGLGIDCDANRSFNYQARQLQNRNSPGIMAARNGSVTIKFKAARDALSNLIKVSPGNQPPQTAENIHFSDPQLNEGSWIFGDLKSAGISLSGPNKVSIGLDTTEAKKLFTALKAGEPATVKSKTGKRFEFEPTDEGYFIYDREKPVISAILSKEDMDILQLDIEDAEVNSTREAEKAFYDFISTIEDEDDRKKIEHNAYGNAFDENVHDEYENDLERWRAALTTAKEYVDQGVTSY